MNRLGIDLGGTKTEAILLDGNGAVLKRSRIPTPRDIYEDILESIDGLVGRVGTGRFSIGVCTPGAVSRETGVMMNSNTRCLTGRPFREDLERILGRDVTIENDANCFAVAEAVMGAARGYGTVFGVIMGTGVGGGIVVNGRLHRGRTGTAGEWGHHVLHRGGNMCYCGNRGCVETYISGPALERRWQEIGGDALPLREIVVLAGSGNWAAWKSEFLDNFGAALATVIDILDPDAIVLGGGVSNVPFLYDEGRESIRRNVFGGKVDTPILRNSLGDSAGVFGAALLERPA